MFKFRRIRSRFAQSKGQTMVEYALLLGGIAVAVAAGYNGLGSSTNSAVSSATSLIAGNSGNTGGTGTGTGNGNGGGSNDGGGDGDGQHHDHGDGDGH
jgi:Flp pilus assembly pilin Flp